MKIVKFKLTAITPKITMIVTDVLGNEYTIDRTARIHEYYYPETHYDIVDMKRLEIKSTFLGNGGSDGIQVAADIWIRVAKVHFIKIEDVEVTEIVELAYRWFKPKLKYTDRIKCKEIA